MMDIVERLRANQCKERQGGCGSMTVCLCADADDAADEIQRLRADKNCLTRSKSHMSSPPCQTRRTPMTNALHEMPKGM